MAAKFTHGDSLASTRKTASMSPPPNAVRGAGHGKSGGMPGFINTRQSDSRGSAPGGKSLSPRREGYIGERGGSGAKGMGKAGKAAGTVTANYKRASSGTGSVQGNTIGSPGPRSSHRMAPQKAPPTARGKIPGGRSQGGKMESLRGKAQFRAERPRKSMMY
nr:hypothetical protein [uncultured Rhodopila sp.]